MMEGMKYWLKLLVWEAKKCSDCKDRNTIQEKVYHLNSPEGDLEGNLRACKSQIDGKFWFSQQINIFKWGSHQLFLP